MKRSKRRAMRKTINFILIAFCIISSVSYASEKDIGTITGKIISNETGQSISSATIALVNETDSLIIASIASGKDGEFELNNVPIGKYRLQITSLNRKPSIIENIEISAQGSNVKLGHLTLTEDAEEFLLDEITVVTGRLKGEELVDRTIYTINDDIRKASSSGLTMLRYVPSVTVDFMDNVTLEGRSDIQFYVDGVKRNKEFVAQLDPQMIDRVELITNPSVQYDSDISGVISIMLKRDERSGFSGSVTIPLPNPDKTVAYPAASFDYGYKNVRLFAGDRLNYQRLNQRGSTLREWNDPSGNSHRIEKNSTGTLRTANNYLNFGVDWFINDKTALNFLGEVTADKFSPGDSSSENRSYLNNRPDQYFETDMDTKYHYDNQFFSLFLRRELEQEGCEFKVEVYFNRQSGGASHENVDTYYDIQDLSTITSVTASKDTADDSHKTAQLKADYSFMVKDIKNEIGLKSFAGWADNEFSQISNPNVPAAVDIDHFAYDEMRQSVYYNTLGEMNKVKWQFGVTGEYSGVDIAEGPETADFFLLPQASLQRDFENAGDVKLSFQKKIERPDTRQLDPFEIIVDSQHVRKGNPDLKPEVENSVELTYSKNFKNNFVSPKLYYQYTNNAIQEVTSIRSDGISETVYGNIGKNVEYGLGLNASLQPASRWRLNGNMSVYNTEISTGRAYGNDNKQKKTSYRFNATKIFTLPRDYSLSAIIQYNSPYLTYRRENYCDLLVLLGLGKKFSSMAEINLIYVPLITNYTYTKTITSYPGYREETASRLDAQNLFFIEFKYNFNYGKKIKKIERSIEHETSKTSGGL